MPQGEKTEPKILLWFSVTRGWILANIWYRATCGRALSTYYMAKSWTATILVISLVHSDWRKPIFSSFELLIKTPMVLLFSYIIFNITPTFVSLHLISFFFIFIFSEPNDYRPEKWWSSQELSHLTVLDFSSPKALPNQKKKRAKQTLKIQPVNLAESLCGEKFNLLIFVFFTSRLSFYLVNQDHLTGRLFKISPINWSMSG